jgi:hypothetical protein
MLEPDEMGLEWVKPWTPQYRCLLESDVSIDRMLINNPRTLESFATYSFRPSQTAMSMGPTLPLYHRGLLFQFQTEGAPVQ